VTRAVPPSGVAVYCDGGRDLHRRVEINVSTPLVIRDGETDTIVNRTEHLSPSVGSAVYVLRCPLCTRAPRVRPGRWDAAIARLRAAGHVELNLAHLPF
jgi:hypothetical protein